MNPEEELAAIKSVEERIKAVAIDVSERKDRFKKIDPMILAELLGLDPHDLNEWSRSPACRRVVLSDICDQLADYVGYLRGRVPQDRYLIIEKEADDFATGKASSDVVLSDEERAIIEDELTEKSLEDGADWVVASKSAEAPNGECVDFEAGIGDGGDCFGFYGPYEIRDETATESKDVHYGDCY